MKYVKKKIEVLPVTTGIYDEKNSCLKTSTTKGLLSHKV